MLIRLIELLFYSQELCFFFLWTFVWCELTKSLWGAFCGVEGLHRSGFFSPETILQTRALYSAFNWILLCLMAWVVWADRSRLKPNFKGRGPVLAQSLLERGEVWHGGWVFSLAKLRRSFERSPPARRGISEQRSEERLHRLRVSVQSLGILRRWQLMTKQLAPFSLLEV